MGDEPKLRHKFFTLYLTPVGYIYNVNFNQLLSYWRFIMQNFYLSQGHIQDNTQFWKENSEKDYVNCIQNLIQSRPFGDHKFYIFSIVKRVDDESGIKKMYHQPRLTRPDPVPGTTLIKVDPNDPETATIIWTLPNEENFNFYKSGKLFADPFVHECIEKYRKNPRELITADPDDLSESQIREIYNDMKMKGRTKKQKKKPTKP